MTTKYPPRAKEHLLEVAENNFTGLTDRQRQLVHEFESGSSIGKVARKWGVSRERIRQIALSAKPKKVDNTLELVVADYALNAALMVQPDELVNEEPFQGITEMFISTRREMGCIPTMKKWDETHQTPSSADIVKHFGSWGKAWMDCIGEKPRLGRPAKTK